MNLYPFQRPWVKRKIINKYSESLLKDFTDGLDKIIKFSYLHLSAQINLDVIIIYGNSE